MIVHEGYKNLELKNPVVTMGIFDGVHRGHRALINKVLSVAKETQGESVLITYYPHPRLVLEEGSANVSLLNSPEEKISLLASTGADHLIIIDFTPAFSRITASSFIKEVLVSQIRARHFIMGYDHRFGYRGEGDYDTIIRLAETMDITVLQSEGMEEGDITISSSLIREALLTGRLEDANRWLGYSYFLKGRVIEGEKLGRKLGFPTANISPLYKYKLIPADGVYAVEAKVEGSTMKAMLSIGNKPTIREEPGERSIEVNIFDFNKDIYNKEIEVIFRYRLRDEIKFANTQQLVRQMKNDKVKAINLLS
ncbi:MAG TPA: bifunctional riboflavin kinase/FAD synthetase [Bacteroidales bacterium]|nr:bifunctional riboflavin kinase/FAD synthetase [Bacteroidales bacterium]HPI67812.1 bifunctional riboflavin kinase/FAD synthetase [Bacteroidales bacterium]HPR72353.1 bifunctional riboflavin kinase/FAD synthetase [Bacteroidales bacterium]